MAMKPMEELYASNRTLNMSSIAVPNHTSFALDRTLCENFPFWCVNSSCWTSRINRDGLINGTPSGISDNRMGIQQSSHSEPCNIETKCCLSVESRKRLGCSKCSKSFVSEKRLRTHEMKSHASDGGPLIENVKRKLYQCSQCDRVYGTHYNFKEHLAKHGGKLFECLICKKQLSGQSSLIRHTKMHEKPYECTICANRFSSIYDLECHFSYHHSAKKLFKCDYCERVLYNYSGKLRHQRSCNAQNAKTEPLTPVSEANRLCLKLKNFKQTPSTSVSQHAEVRSEKRHRPRFQIADILGDDCLNYNKENVKDVDYCHA